MKDLSRKVQKTKFGVNYIVIKVINDSNKLDL